MTHEQTVTDYIDGVLAGTIPTGRLARLAVQRHVMDLASASDRGFHFNTKTANDAIDFFPFLKHTTGEFNQEPFELRQFQTFLIWCLFGWKRKDDSRRFRDAFLSFARGNGKSPLAAGIAVALTFFDIPKEPRAEGYCVATKEAQARIVFEEAKRMVAAGDLKALIEPYQTSMYMPADGSALKPLGSDSKSTDGLVIHCIIRDELHEWQERHRGLYDKLETALGKRRQPMGLTITTAGDDMSDLWIEQHDYSKRVVEQALGTPDEWFGDEHFSFICEVDETDDIFEEVNWGKANPMLLEPRSPVKIEHLRNMAAKAKAGDVISENRFRRYHCNQKVSSLNKAFTPESWMAGDKPLLRDARTPGFAAFDLGRNSDFCAITAVWKVEEVFEVQTWIWTVTKRKEDLSGGEFRHLLKQDNVTIHEGSNVEYADVRRKAVELNKAYNLGGWHFDPWFAQDTGQMLQDENGLQIASFNQSARMYNEPIVRFGEELTKGNIRHGGCPVLKWQADNLVLASNYLGLLMPAKKDSRYRIDSIVAMYMAFHGLLLQPKTPKLDYYETHELELM